MIFCVYPISPTGRSLFTLITSSASTVTFSRAVDLNRDSGWIFRHGPVCIWRDAKTNEPSKRESVAMRLLQISGADFQEPPCIPSGPWKPYWHQASALCHIPSFHSFGNVYDAGACACESAVHFQLNSRRSRKPSKVDDDDEVFKCSCAAQMGTGSLFGLCPESTFRSELLCPFVCPSTFLATWEQKERPK